MFDHSCYDASDEGRAQKVTMPAPSEIRPKKNNSLSLADELTKETSIVCMKDRQLKVERNERRPEKKEKKNTTSCEVNRVESSQVNVFYTTLLFSSSGFSSLVDGERFRPRLHPHAVEFESLRKIVPIALLKRTTKKEE
jgi:hypothetical protein